jgi:hypothetical protein
MKTKRQIRASLSIGGVDYGLFDSVTGIVTDGDETKYTPADGIRRTAVGEAQDGNPVLSRMYESSRDGVIGKNRRALHGQPALVTPYDRDEDGNWQQNISPVEGAVKTITCPEGDSDSNDTTMISIEISAGQLV